MIEQDANDTFALLLTYGTVKALSVDANGHTTLLAVRTRGDVVGEMAALTGKPRSATVVTCGDVKAQQISCGELNRFLGQHGDALYVLTTLMIDRFRWANERRCDFSSLPAERRLARVLVELVQTYGREHEGSWRLDVPLTNIEVASIGGMKGRTAEKAFRELREAGLVQSHARRNLLVPDLDGLRRFAEI